MPGKPTQLGVRLREFREEKGLSLNALAARTRIAKSYLWSLENDPSANRPSGETLYKIAQALGVTMSELLGHRLLTDPPDAIPPSLQDLADELGLGESDVRMLAGIQFRGDRPKTKRRWQYIYDAIRISETIEAERRPPKRRSS